ncbi:MAG: hypothetical protein J6G98_02480 [Bacilli bacterium]|nr:hypothetical protein [Bacilli bacterium]
MKLIIEDLIYLIKEKWKKATKHINAEMDEATEEFYQTKKGKKKDDYGM